MKPQKTLSFVRMFVIPALVGLSAIPITATLFNLIY